MVQINRAAIPEVEKPMSASKISFSQSKCKAQSHANPSPLTTTQWYFIPACLFPHEDMYKLILL